MNTEYTARYEGLTVLGGMHMWSIIAPDSSKLCVIVALDKDIGQEQLYNLLDALNRTN